MTNHNLNVCLFPMELIWDDVEANLENLKKSLEKLHPLTDILILPETFTTGFPTNAEKDSVSNLVEPSQQYVISTIKELAAKYNIAIAGSIIVKDEDSLCNRAFFIEPSGDEYYADKRHLFTMAGEDKVFSSGVRRMKVRFRGWNIAMVVCYDIRFPVWCRNVGNEYDLLIVIANWPSVRIGAWEKLLPARAIENLSYLAAVNCRGEDKNGFNYNGSSGIFDFKGDSIGVASAPFVYAKLDYQKLDRFRQKFPAWKDADRFSLSD